MPRKGKRRRDEQRARRARPEESQATETPSPAAPPAERPRPREQRRPAARRRGSGGFRVPAGLLWGTGALALAGGFIAVIVILVSSGGSSDSAASNPAKTAPALLGGKPPEVTLTVDATDQGQATNTLFSPDALTAKAGQVVKIVMVNKGSVVHNLHVAGANNQYDDPDVPGTDDWITTPQSVEAGAEGSLLLKIDKAGAYAFKCDFHPDQQKGTLTLTP